MRTFAKTLALAFTGLALGAGPVGGQGAQRFEDGNRTVQNLLRDCRAGLDAAEGEASAPDEFPMYCAGLVIGVSGVLKTGCALKARGVTVPDYLTMATGGNTYGAMTRAFINWAEDNPNKWGDQGFVGMVAALASAFPCEH